MARSNFFHIICFCNFKFYILIFHNCVLKNKIRFFIYLLFLYFLIRIQIPITWINRIIRKVFNILLLYFSTFLRKFIYLFNSFCYRTRLFKTNLTFLKLSGKLCYKSLKLVFQASFPEIFNCTVRFSFIFESVILFCDIVFYYV